MPSRQARLAERLIQKYGREVRLRFFDTGSTPPDPDKPWRLPDPEHQFLSVYAVFLDTQTTDLLARVSAVSRLVLSPVAVNQTVALIAGTVAVVPKIDMSLVDTDRSWLIKRVTPVEPGANGPALFTLDLGN